MRKGGVKYRQADLFSAISEPLGINGCALATFPEYDGRQNAHFPNPQFHQEFQNSGRRTP
jgi:hypothetical protein